MIRDPRVEPRAGDVVQRIGRDAVVVRWVDSEFRGVAYITRGGVNLYATSVKAWRKNYATATIIHVAEG